MVTKAPSAMQLRDAKASFSAVVDRAAAGDATLVTRRGKPAAVVVGYDAWQRLVASRPSFADLLLGFPDVGEIRRDPSPARDAGA